MISHLIKGEFDKISLVDWIIIIFISAVFTLLLFMVILTCIRVMQKKEEKQRIAALLNNQDRPDEQTQNYELDLIDSDIFPNPVKRKKQEKENLFGPSGLQSI